MIAQVVGSTDIMLKVPLEERAMPFLQITLKTATMDGNGHVIWPSSFATATAAALRKQMRFHLQAMIESPKYPTLTVMAPALTLTSESVRPEPPAAPARASQQQLRLLA